MKIKKLSPFGLTILLYAAILAGILIALLFLQSCSDSHSNSSAENYPLEDSTGDTIEEKPIKQDPIEEDPPIQGPVLLALTFEDKLYLYNGGFSLLDNINPKNCGFRCFADGNVKSFYDDDGNVERQEYIAIEPDLILDDWMIENVDPQTAYSMGAQARDYTKIYFQGSESGNWFENQWKAVQLIKTISGEIICIDENSGYHVLTSELSNINHAQDLIVYDFDSDRKTAMIDGDNVSWTTNYFNKADQWLKSGDVWYSWNGYEFDGNLTEYANSMFVWNNGVYPVTVLSPTLLAAGALEKNSETVLYWIEANTGWMIRYIPSIDRLETVYRIYQGDGDRLTGVYNRDNLKPVLIGGDLYFNESGSVWKLGVDSGIVELFFLLVRGRFWDGKMVQKSQCLLCDVSR